MVEKELLKKYLFGELSKGVKIYDWNDDESLLETGIIDSLNIIQLLVFIEEKFGVKIGDDDLSPDNFENLNSLVTLIRKKI